MEQGMLKAGDDFGKYTVERLLGTGGMGAVYQVRHQLLGSLYALKVLDSASAAKKNGDIVERFHREAKIASNTRHPNLAEVYDAGFDEAHGLHYLVMEYLPGGNLRDRLAERGRFAPQEAIHIVRQVAAVLVTMAQHGIVHRDIKPDNIMFSANGAAKLTDLGIAKGNGEQDTLRTMASAVFGTPSYMAPEQAQDASSVDCRADIWSLGVVLYEMLSGRRPYEGKNFSAIVSQLLSSDPFPDIRAVAPDVPDAVANLLGEMCMKDREKRLATPRELYERLGDLNKRLATLVSAPPRPSVTNTLATQVTMATEKTMGTIDASPTEAEPSVFVEPEPDPEVEMFEKNVIKKMQRKQEGRHGLRIAIAVLAGLVFLLFGWALLNLTKRSAAPAAHGGENAEPQVPVTAVTSNAVAGTEQMPPEQPTAVSNVVDGVGQIVSDPPIVTTNEPPVLPPPVDDSIALVGSEREANLLRAFAGGRGRFYRIAGRPDDVATQIGAVVAAHPGKIYLSLTGYAASREMSQVRFELFLREVAKSLASANVPFVLVADATVYGRIVRTVAQEQSWDVTD